MSTSRLDRATLDRLLEGAPARRDDLDTLLAAVRAAGSVEELAGLEAAVAAFVSAPLAGSTRRVPVALGAGPARSRRSARLTAFGARVAVAAAAGAAALGGVSLAATSDGTPQSLPSAVAASAAARPSVVPATRPAGRGGVDSTDEQSAAPGTAGGSDQLPPTAVPVPSLRGLCQAWNSRPSGAGRADSSAAFEVLVHTAGGHDQVTAYCAAIFPARPGHGSRHTSHPHSAGATHVPGRPTDLPPIGGHGNRPGGSPLRPAHENKPTSLPSAVPARPNSR